MNIDKSYMGCFGRMKTHITPTAVANGEITSELQPISVFINKELTNDNN